MASPSSIQAARPFRVGIVGGGVAGITALMALADLGDRTLDVELLTPAADFVLRPQLIGRPWGGPPVRVPLAELTAAHGARHRAGRVVGIGPMTPRVHMSDGHEAAYDALLLAPGAVPGLAYTGIWTVGFGPLPDALAGAGRGSLAIIVPPGTSWTLPAYQLALLAAGSGRASVRVLTPEAAPLEVFGPGAAAAIAGLLARAGVEVQTAFALPAGSSDAAGLADHVVALPVLTGPELFGLPHAEGGFIPLGPEQTVPGCPGVFAAGDATTAPIKQGGLAADAAEHAAAAVLRSAGLEPPAVDGPRRLRGKLTLPGGPELFLRRTLDGHDPGETSERPLWQPGASLLAWRLSRWLSVHEQQGGRDALGPLARPQAVHG